MLKKVGKLAGVICMVYVLLVNSVENTRLISAKTDTYTIIFVANGGNGSMSSQKIKYVKRWH